MESVAGGPGPARPPGELRASDADRDRAAEVLRTAAGEGRLTLDELDERLHAAYTARTYAELEAVTRDLPEGTVGVAATAGVPAAAADERLGGHWGSRVALSVMGGFSRRGSWTVPRRLTAISVMGGGALDLRQARFAEGEATINVVAVMGGIDVTVPEDAEVRVSGVGILGGLGGHRPSGPGRPGAPRIVINYVGIMGGISVRRRPAEDADGAGPHPAGAA
jgi:Domain of unknown function (DUF1707)/Cell wall-active antibiotics response 4TMS YvqF